MKPLKFDLDILKLDKLVDGRTGLQAWTLDFETENLGIKTYRLLHVRYLQRVVAESDAYSTFGRRCRPTDNA